MINTKRVHQFKRSVKNIKCQLSVLSVNSYQDDVFIMFRTAKAALLQTTKAIEKSIQVSFGSDASADADRRSRK